MALVVDGGGLVNKGGALGTGAACCCAAPCCTCNSTFSFYANGRILDGYNSDFTGFGLQTVAIIPGLGFPVGNWQNSGWFCNPVCDANGNLIVRILLTQRGQNRLNDDEGPNIEGRVIEYRYYRFDLSGGGCGVITGEPIPLPDDAGDFYAGCGLSVGWVEGAVVDGDVIRIVDELGDGGNNQPEDIDPSPLHLDWSGIVVQASCQIACPGGVVYLGSFFDTFAEFPPSCEEAEVDCGNENCECQPTEAASSNFPKGGWDSFSTAYAHCILNPLP